MQKAFGPEGTEFDMEVFKPNNILVRWVLDFCLMLTIYFQIFEFMSLHKWRYNIQSHSLVNLHLRKSVDVSSLNTALTTKLSENHHAVTNHLKQDQSQAQKIDEDKGCLPWGEGAVVSLVNVSFLSGWSEFELQTRTLY